MYLLVCVIVGWGPVFSTNIQTRGAHKHTRQGVSIYVLLPHKDPLPGRQQQQQQERPTDAARYTQTRLVSLPNAPGRIHVRDIGSFAPA